MRLQEKAGQLCFCGQRQGDLREEITAILAGIDEFTQDIAANVIAVTGTEIGKAHVVVTGTVRADVYEDRIVRFGTKNFDIGAAPVVDLPRAVHVNGRASRVDRVVVDV